MRFFCQSLLSADKLRMKEEREEGRREWRRFREWGFSRPEESCPLEKCARAGGSVGGREREGGSVVRWGTMKTVNILPGRRGGAHDQRPRPPPPSQCQAQTLPSFSPHSCGHARLAALSPPFPSPLFPWVPIAPPDYLLSFLALFFFCVCGKWQARPQVEAGEINSHYTGWL